MAGMIDISAKLDAKPFLKGVDDMSTALENVDDDIKSTAIDGDKQVKKLEQSFADAAKAARDTGEQIDTGISHGVRGGVEEADIHFSSFKKSAKDAAKTAAASFDGTAESAVAATQQLTGTALSAFPVVGAAATAALGVGFGLVNSFIQQQQQLADEAAKHISDLTKEFIDANKNQVDFKYITDQIEQFATATDDGTEKLKELKSIADKVGVPFDVFTEAVAGNQDAIDALLPTLKKHKEEQDAIKNSTTEWTTEVATASVKSGEYAAAIAKLEAQQTALKGATDAATLADQAGLEVYRTKADLIENINSEFDNATSKITDYYDAETNVLDITAFQQSFQSRQDILDTYQQQISDMKLTPAQLGALNDMGMSASTQWMKGMTEGTEEQRQWFKDKLTEIASDSSGQAKNVMNQIFKEDTPATIKVTVDKAQAERDFAELQTTINKKVLVDWRDRYGKPVY